MAKNQRETECRGETRSKRCGMKGKGEQKHNRGREIGKGSGGGMGVEGGVVEKLWCVTLCTLVSPAP